MEQKTFFILPVQIFCIFVTTNRIMELSLNFKEVYM